MSANAITFVLLIDKVRKLANIGVFRHPCTDHIGQGPTISPETSRSPPASRKSGPSTGRPFRPSGGINGPQASAPTTSKPVPPGAHVQGNLSFRDEDDIVDVLTVLAKAADCPPPTATHFDLLKGTPPFHLKCFPICLFQWIDVSLVSYCFC